MHYFQTASKMISGAMNNTIFLQRDPRGQPDTSYSIANLGLLSRCKGVIDFDPGRAHRISTRGVLSNSQRTIKSFEYN